jgi:hypothetical protein
MPIYFFKIEGYNIVEAKEMNDETDAPQTLINIDKDGTGNLAFHAPDVEKAKQYMDEHIKIHKNWNLTDLSS